MGWEFDQNSGETWWNEEGGSDFPYGAEYNNEPSDEYWDQLYGTGGGSVPGPDDPTFSSTTWDPSNLYGLPQNRNPYSLYPNPGDGGGGGAPITGGQSMTADPYGLEMGTSFANRTGTRDVYGPTGDPTSTPITGPGSTTNNATTNNSLTNNINAAAISATQNNPPPISESVPEGNNAQFTPQQLPQSRRMNPAGMDSNRRPYSIPDSSAMPEPDQPLSKAGSGVPVGGGRNIPTTPRTPSIMDTLKQNALSMAGVNRYKKLLQDVKGGRGMGSLYGPYN